MPRNEFKARDFLISELQDMTDLQLQDMLRDDLITRADIRRARKPSTSTWEGSENEDLDQEVIPVEDDPQEEPSVRSSLADLRKRPGASTTEAHIAEVYGAEDTPLI